MCNCSACKKKTKCEFAYKPDLIYLPCGMFEYQPVLLGVSIPKKLDDLIVGINNKTTPLERAVKGQL